MNAAYVAPAGPLQILHIDAALVGVAKPPGLLSVPGRGAARADCLAARIAALVAGARSVHRLDMETSGAMIFARDPDTHRALSRAFAERAVEKRYVAIVAGRMADEHGEITLPLRADWANRPRQIVDPVAGRAALTRFCVSSLACDTTRVILAPVTGRSHQLRVHLHAIGHPILGDTLYARGSWRTAAPRLMLHAERLTLAHPRTGKPLVLRVPAPF